MNSTGDERRADHVTDSCSHPDYTSGFGLGQSRSHRGIRGTC